MDVLVERCAGIDVGKADVKVCVRVPGRRAGTRRQEVRTFGATTRQLLRLADWLVDQRVSLVGMESTGQYWKPVYYLLEDVIDGCWVVNARQVKNVPGRKTDVSDAAWICQLLEHGLLRPSFVPPKPLRRLRDLTRYRTSLVHERVRAAQRLQDVLEDAGIKLACVATDILGVSGRDMIGHLIAGERDPHRLADLARRRMRTKLPELEEALTGHFDDHHGLLCQLMLDHIDTLNAQIGQLDDQIEAQMAPFRAARDHLRTIPGVSTRTAEVIIAETGADMSRFPSPAHLASWAGMCPGNNESAGRHHSGKTRNGDPWLRGALGEAAMAAARTKNTYLSDRYRRLAARRGKKKAIVAVGHDILNATWHMLTDHTDYHDLGADYHLTRIGDPRRRVRHLTSQLTALGYHVTLEPTT